MIFEGLKGVPLRTGTKLKLQTRYQTGTSHQDIRKAAENLRKHRVSFEEAGTVFGDPLSLTIHDPLHSEQEDRFIILGQSVKQRVLIVVHAERKGNIRLISARIANSHERKTYEENN